MENVDLLAKWTELKAFVDSLDKDVLKTVKGNNAAGVRVRKSLRDLKKLASQLVKDSIVVVKSVKADKKSTKTA